MNIKEKLEKAVSLASEYFTTHGAVDHDQLQKIISDFACEVLKEVEVKRIKSKELAGWSTSEVDRIAVVIWCDSRDDAWRKVRNDSLNELQGKKV